MDPIVDLPVPREWLRRFPNTALGVPLGLGGQVVLWKNVQGWGRMDYLPAESLNIFFWWCTVIVFLMFLLLLCMKAFCWRSVIQKEWAHPIRFNFFLGPPVIALCFLSIGLPTSMDVSQGTLRALWSIAFICQSVFGLIAYHKWAYNTEIKQTAATAYLLCIVSWFLLPILGQSPAVDIDTWTSLPLMAMCFGIGWFWILLVYPFIFVGIMTGGWKGHPSLFLLLAPPAAAGIASGGPSLLGSYGLFAEMIFGAMVFLFAFLLAGKPQILNKPALFGHYWAYVFPPVALAILAIKVAAARDADHMDAIAAAMVIIATVFFLVVFVRMMVHMVYVFAGSERWGDPIADGMPQPARQMLSPNYEEGDQELPNSFAVSR